MSDIVADAFRGMLDGDDVLLEFGHGKAADAGGPGVDLDLRAAMPVDVARRLLVRLTDAVKEHERRHDTKRTPPGATPGGRSLLGETPVNAPPDPAAERAAVLLRLVGELAVPCQYERSFRMSPGQLLANRYLLSVNAGDITGDARARVMELCAALEMPADLQSTAGEQFDMASCLHFGFEGGSDSIVYKLYFERAVPAAEAESARASGEPALLHLAFKWDIVRKRHVRTRYLWYPSLGAREIAQRIAAVYGGTAAPSFEIAKAILESAAGRTAPEKLQYLEVKEDNGRWSFDLNVYDTSLLVKDIQGPLHRMREHFGVRPGQFQALFDQIRNRALGHVAGGMHRAGEDFFNIYYGASGFPRFAEPWR